MKDKATLIDRLGKVPFLGPGLRWFSHYYPEGSVVTIKNGRLAGYKWKRSHKHVSGYWLGIYELPVQKCLSRELKPGDVFYDIGASAGFFTLLGSKCVGEKGHVFAFEPLPENIETISNQLILNDIKNTTQIEVALADSIGNAELREGPNVSAASIKRWKDKEHRTITVKTTTLDEFSMTRRHPNFIKMDIEGAEVLALKGACKLLSGKNPPGLLIELHGHDIAKEVRNFLERKNYCFYTLDLMKIDSATLPLHVLAIPKKTNKS